MPSCSTGFWVANTRNGMGRGTAWPSPVTCIYLMASSRPAWVLSGVRLISSASSRLVKTGPWRKRKEPSRCSKIVWPSTSDGIRSGLNCTRLKLRSSVRARVFTSSVFATPGTPSSRTWPRTSSAATSPDTAPSCPTTALAISWRTRSTASLWSVWTGSPDDGVEPALLPGCVSTYDLRADGVDGLAERDELGLVARRGRLDGGQDALPPDPGAGRDSAGHLLGGRRRRQPEPFGQGAAQAIGEQCRRLLAVPSALKKVADGDHQLRTGDPDRRRLGHRPAQPAAAPQGEQEEGHQELPERELDPRRDQIAEALGAGTWRWGLQDPDLGAGCGREQADQEHGVVRAGQLLVDQGAGPAEADHRATADRLGDHPGAAVPREAALCARRHPEREPARCRDAPHVPRRRQRAARLELGADQPDPGAPDGLDPRDRGARVGHDQRAAVAHPAEEPCPPGLVQVVGEQERGAAGRQLARHRDPGVELPQRLDQRLGAPRPWRAGVEGIALVTPARPHERRDQDAGGDQAPHQQRPGPSHPGTSFMRCLSCRCRSRTRPARSRKRVASPAPVGRRPYQARSNSSVAPANASAAPGRLRPTSPRYSPAVRPAASSTTPRLARSATSAR